MRILLGFLAGLVSVVGCAGQAAATPPKELVGKSVTVTWAETRVQRHVGVSDFRTVNASHRMIVYVSTAGRVFTRLINTTRAGTGKSDQVEGEPGALARFRARVPNFSGRTMTIFQPFVQGGMRRLVVTFDGGFASCTARVSNAKEEGHATSIAWSPIVKKYVEFQSATTSGESCSVVSGNLFGSE